MEENLGLFNYYQLPIPDFTKIVSQEVLIGEMVKVEVT